MQCILSTLLILLQRMLMSSMSLYTQWVYVLNQILLHYKYETQTQARNLLSSIKQYSAQLPRDELRGPCQLLLLLGIHEILLNSFT